MKEADIQRQIQIAVSQFGARVFRNQVGAHQKGPHFITYGLCKGSSDLIGWTSRGHFLAIEVKRPGQRPTKEQKLFIDVVNRNNGIAFVATSAKEALEKLAELTHERHVDDISRDAGL